MIKLPDGVDGYTREQCEADRARWIVGSIPHFPGYIWIGETKPTPEGLNMFNNVSDIDNMTENQIDEEIEELVKLKGAGSMTPANAFRLSGLRAGKRAIRGARKWLF